MKLICVVLISLLTPWLIGAFVSLEPNPLHWAQVSRGMAVIFAAGIAALLTASRWAP